MNGIKVRIVHWSLHYYTIRMFGFIRLFEKKGIIKDTELELAINLDGFYSLQFLQFNYCIEGVTVVRWRFFISESASFEYEFYLQIRKTKEFFSIWKSPEYLNFSRGLFNVHIQNTTWLGLSFGIVYWDLGQKQI